MRRTGYIKGIICTVIFVCSFFRISAQVGMYFCINEGSDHSFNGCATIFNASSSGGHIDVILVAPHGQTLNTKDILYMVYKDTVYEASLYRHDMAPSWTYCCKQIDLCQPGRYRIDVYDLNKFEPITQDYGVLISRGFVTINNR